MEEPIQEKNVEWKLCGRIQHFYDFLSERKNKISEEMILKSHLSPVDEEIDSIMNYFQKTFKDIVYKE